MRNLRGAFVLRGCLNSGHHFDLCTLEGISLNHKPSYSSQRAQQASQIQEALAEDATSRVVITGAWEVIPTISPVISFHLSILKMNGLV